MQRLSQIGFVFIIISLLPSACRPGEVPVPIITPGQTNISLPVSQPSPTFTATPTFTPNPTSTPTLMGSGGKWIAYTDVKIISAQEEKFIYNIFKLNLLDPGAQPLNLTYNDDSNIGYMYPNWSPDGKKITFHKVTKINLTKTKSELFMMDENGKNIQMISTAPISPGNLNVENLLYDWEPSWSPDGTEIVFSSNRSTLTSDPNNYQLFIMDLSTLKIRQVTHLFGSCETPAWSPDGTEIAFMSNQTGSYNIWIIRPDGTNLRRVTNGPSADRFPRWLPDGSRIIFHSDRDQNFELYTVSPDSTNLTQLTNDPAIDAAAQYSPDGKWIVFQSDRDGIESLYIMTSKGLQIKKISNSNNVNVNASWQPR
jgi:Tol biopolymer transport system component